MSLKVKPVLNTPHLWKLTTADGFWVGTVDMRGDVRSQIDTPHAHLDFDRQAWTAISIRQQGIDWVESRWAETVRRWASEL